MLNAILCASAFIVILTMWLAIGYLKKQVDEITIVVNRLYEYVDQLCEVSKTSAEMLGELDERTNWMDMVDREFSGK